LTWVSSDNTYTPDWVESLTELVDDDTGAIYSDFNYNKNGQSRRLGWEYEPNHIIKPPHDCLFGPSFIIRVDVWERAGGHRGKNAHDYDHWLRVEEACWEMGLKIRRCPKALCNYNAHDQRATVVRRGPKWDDKAHWAKEARERRGLCRGASQS